jgi:hypothetical protein
LGLFFLLHYLLTKKINEGLIMTKKYLLLSALTFAFVSPSYAKHPDGSGNPGSRQRAFECDRIYGAGSDNFFDCVNHKADGPVSPEDPIDGPW